MKSSTANCRRKKIPADYTASLKKYVLAVLSLLLLLFAVKANAQTLFTYGKHAVSKQEFLKAYNKNNTDSAARQISYEEYLELYTRFKLKVQAAKDEGMDTTSQQKNELESFRYQLSDNFIKEDASTKLLVDEAFERSLKDVSISYIFIPLVPNADSAAVQSGREKINVIYDELKKGTAFDKAGSGYEHGSVGYITVFVLPYEIENVAYSIPEGKFSEPFKTAAGFFILKNNGERKAVGKIRVSQILLGFSPGMQETEKKELRKKADSLYNELLEGGSFADSAKKYSNDNLTYMNGGEIPAFGLGEYDTAFTNAAFALQKDGDLSSPVMTSFGYHILLRLQKMDVIDDKSNKANMEMLKEKVLQSDRMRAGQAMLVKNIESKVLKDIPSSDLANDSAIFEYYRTHLEKYNREYADQVNEFREGNLLFGIMQKKIWDLASADSAALHNYYNTHRDKYNWDMSADAIILTCSDPKAVDSIQQAMKNNVSQWRELVEKSNGMIQADSGRFELGQIPVAERTNFTEGLITAPVTNEQDNSKTFAFILKMHNVKEPKNFEEAKGSVINDYQVFLEEQWIAQLKKKYPVKVNKKVFKNLPKNF